MAIPISPVRTALMYRRGARLFWKSKMGGMKPGLQCGYAITAFDTELELRSAVQTIKYSELFQVFKWKVGTSEITETRLEEMFKIKRPLNDPIDIWERYYIPFNKRLSKYQGDTKALIADHDEFQREVLVKKYIKRGHVAMLMIPLVIGFKGNAGDLEMEMSKMIVRHGGEVWNDKETQEKKERASATRADMNLVDRMPDKLLKLTPTLQKLGFELHPELKVRR